ncbi:MAG: succinate dehydrogenase [Archaeoglobaceae archaeon]
MRGFEPLAWLFQVITGAAMVFLITVHFLSTHTAHQSLSYESVVSRLKSMDYKIFYALLLIFVSFHAFNGLRAIILDTEKGMRKKRAVNAITFSLAIAAICYGIFLLSKF